MVAMCLMSFSTLRSSSLWRIDTIFRLFEKTVRCPVSLDLRGYPFLTAFVVLNLQIERIDRLICFSRDRLLFFF